MAFSPDQQKVAIAPAPQGGELTAAPRPAENAPAVALAARDDEANRSRAAAAPMEAPHAPVDEIGGAAATAAKDRTPEAADDLFDTSDDRLLVVQCDVTTRADAEAALRELLATEQIAWRSQMPQAPQAAPQGAGKSLMAIKKPGANLPDVTAPAAEAADAAAPDAIYIVAEKQQLQTALDSLQASGTFRNVTLSQRSAPADALATYDELSNVDQSTAEEGVKRAGQKETTTEAIRTAQNQFGRAMQLPLAEAQTNLQLPDAAPAADVADAGQESPASLPARQRIQRDARPSPAQQTLSGNTSRALIILRVAPESAAATPAEPPAKQE